MAKRWPSPTPPPWARGRWCLPVPTPATSSRPAQVILGSTNFTITDANVATDFANPVFAVFGLQPNSTAGEGAVCGLRNDLDLWCRDGNEFEDFTKEGSDIIANLTPSGQFNNDASYLTASTIIVTTNDAWWVNWTQPAIGFTLATSTNLAHPNWINPGWYSGYTDTNAPRVMPLTHLSPTFWVLLPRTTLPTANGQPNPSSAGSRPVGTHGILPRLDERGVALRSSAARVTTG